MEKKLNNLTELSTFLTTVSDSNKQDDQLSFVIKTQLEVIQSLNSIKMASFAIDNVIDLLKEKIDYTTDEKEKSYYQVQASTMIQSIFLFARARLHILANERKEATLKLIEQGIGILEKTTTAIFDAGKTALIDSGTLGINKITFGDSIKKSIISAVSNRKSNEKPSRSFLGKIADRKIAKRALEDAEDEYEELVLSFSEKAIEYRELFGNSVVFKELLQYYHQKIEIEPVVGLDIARWPIFDVMFVLFSLLINKIYSSTRNGLIFVGISIGILQIILIFSIFYLFKKGKKCITNCESSFKQLKNNLVPGNEYLKSKETAEKLVQRFEGLKTLNMVVSIIIMSVGILALGTALILLFWSFKRNIAVKIFSKIAAIIIGIITIIIEIIYIHKKTE